MEVSEKKVLIDWFACRGKISEEHSTLNIEPLTLKPFQSVGSKMLPRRWGLRETSSNGVNESELPERPK